MARVTVLRLSALVCLVGGLACGKDDSAGSDAPACGNSVLEAGELCDAPNLGGETCQSLGFTAGELLCGPDCRSFAVDGCCNDDCGPT